MYYEVQNMVRFGMLCGVAGMIAGLFAPTAQGGSFVTGGAILLGASMISKAVVASKMSDEK